MKNKKRLVVALWAGLTVLLSSAQKTQKNPLENYFVNYHAAGQLIRNKAHLDSLRVNDSLKTVTEKIVSLASEQEHPCLKRSLLMRKIFWSRS